MAPNAPGCLQAEANPDAGFIDRLSATLFHVIESAGWSFSFTSSGQTFVVSSEEMVAPDGFLPVILHRASHWMTQAMGDRALMGFRIESRSISRCVPEPMGATASLAMWALFAQFALDDWVKQSPQWEATRTPVSIDDLVAAFDGDLAAQVIPVLPAMALPAPDTASATAT